MAYVEANEPIQRVAQPDNGVFDGALIGMAVGAGGAGIGVLGARASYNGIDKRAQRMNDALDAKQQRTENQMAKDQMAHDAKSQKVGPRFWQKKKYEGALDHVARIQERGNQIVNDMEDMRHQQLRDARTQTANDVSRATKREARQQTSKRFKYGYPAQSAVVSPEDVRHSEAVNNVRQQHRGRVNAINSGFDEMINDTRADTASAVAGSESGQYVNKVGAQMENRRQKINSKYNAKQDAHIQNLQDIAAQREMYQPDKMRANHVYSKHMGGFKKNAAIIGASALIGGGLGMITDAAYSG